MKKWRFFAPNKLTNNARLGHPTGPKVLAVRAVCAAELFDWERACTDYRYRYMVPIH